MRHAGLWAIWGVALTVITLVVWIQISIWSECREHDHSWIYCLRMVTR